MFRGFSLPRFVRATLIVLALVACSGITSLAAAAVHDHGADCGQCDSGCPGNCDSRDCPPGPLCRCAPQLAVAERIVIPTFVGIGADRPLFAIDTRMPTSVAPDGIFHPPRPRR